MRPRNNHNDLILGGKQLAVLQNILLLREEAYGGGLFVRLDKDGQRTLLPQIYSILSKLEQKGLVKHRFSEPGKGRGERRRKIYELTGKGQRVLSASMKESAERTSDGGFALPGFA